VSVEALQECGELVAGEVPLEGLSGLFVAVLEGEQALLDLGEDGDGLWGEDLALDDREGDFDLVEPGRVDGEITVSRGVATPLRGCVSTSAWASADRNPDQVAVAAFAEADVMVHLMHADVRHCIGDREDSYVATLPAALKRMSS
jgi:hypothetical protein